MSSGLTKAPTSSLSIGLAGCGKMGAAMATAWMQSFHVARIDILDPSGVPSEIGISNKVSEFKDAKSFMINAPEWDILVLAVKPQIMDDVCGDIAEKLPNDLTVLSIAAGKPISYFQKQFGNNQPVIRAMPNTPASIGKGISVACASPNVHENAKINANFLLSCMGHIEWIDKEELMNAVTAVSGSGPAYVFYLIEALAKAGVESGLPAEFAMVLARETVIGSAALAETHNTLPASKLRENVTSPNGTTAAALDVLMNGKFQTLMNEAVAKATARGKELSK